MKFSRGLAALILTLFFHTTLFAEYLYKDEVVFNPDFNTEVEKLGSELYEKTGIALRLVMIKELKKDQHIVDYEKEIMKNFSEPTVLLTFSEYDSKVDIYAYPTSLYEYFDRKQVLSPVASPIQAFAMALFYSDSFDSFKEISSSHSGTIIPLLAAKKGDAKGKYAASLYNGYSDIAEQIAISKNVELVNAAGNANKITMTIIKSLFYGIIIYAIFVYTRNKIYARRQERESK